MPLSYESRALSGTRSTGTAWVRGALQQLIGDIPDFRRDLRTPDEVSADEAFPIINRLTQAFRKQVDPKTQRTAFVIQPRGLVMNGGLRGTVKTTGALGALYERTKTTVGEAVVSLERLKPLDPRADIVKFRSVLAIVKSNLDALVAEVQQEPREFQMDGLFASLLDGPPAGGLIGQLQQLAGLDTPNVRQTSDFEQYARFQLVRNSIDGLKRFWNDVWKSGVETGEFGVQFVHVGRLLQAVRETVDSYRTHLDGAGLGDATRWTMQVSFADTDEESMSLESFLDLIDSEASRWSQLLNDGGTMAVPTVLDFVGPVTQLVDHATSELDMLDGTENTNQKPPAAQPRQQGRRTATPTRPATTSSDGMPHADSTKLDELRAGFDIARQRLHNLLTEIGDELRDEAPPETERSAM